MFTGLIHNINFYTNNLYSMYILFITSNENHANIRAFPQVDIHTQRLLKL